MHNNKEKLMLPGAYTALLNFQIPPVNSFNFFTYDISLTYVPHELKLISPFVESIFYREFNENPTLIHLFYD